MGVDVLLVNPLFLSRDPVERRLMTPYFPLGLLYLAACARRAGYSVAVYDGVFEDTPETFQAALDAHQPRLVGLSILSTVRASAIELARMARARNHLVMVGGSDPTARPESYLEAQPGAQPTADIVAIGEGEETLLETLAALKNGGGPQDLASIAGIVYRDEEGRIVVNQPRPLRTDLDALPLPARDLVDLERYRSAWRERHGFFSLSIITSRGCPYACSWCQKSVFGRSYRARSPESVAEEMLEIKTRLRPDRLRIVDDVLGIDKSWIRRWRDAVVALDAAIPFECLSRVDIVDRELLELLRDAGCVRIQFGAESGSQRVLDAMHKGTRVEQIRSAAALCHELGIELYFFIMVGYPGERWRDIKATVRLLRETAPDAFSSTIAYPLPGTPFYHEVRERLSASPDWDYTAENRLMYRGRYSTVFYRWVQRWLHAEWRWVRPAGRDAPPRHTLRSRLGLLLTCLIVRALRLCPSNTRALPSEGEGSASAETV